MKALNFEGNGGEYFKIWIVNVLLVIVTIGLYYPWAKVRNHRYFYGNTTLEGRNFEYHATGKQLFLGYLLAMILFIIFVVVQQFSIQGNLFIALVLFLAIPWVIWRSLKFSMRMTSFSNVRFGFEGTLGESYINFFVLPLLFFIALYGVPIIARVFPFLFLGQEMKSPQWLSMAIPVLMVLALFIAFYLFALIKKRNTAYKINGARYGQGIFTTQLETKKFMVIALKTILVSLFVFGGLFLLIGLVAYGTVGLEALMQMSDQMEDPVAVEENMAQMLPIIGSVYIGLIFGSMVVMAYAMTRQRTYVYENTTLDDKITFESTLKAKPLSWVMISNFLLVVLTLGLAYPWAKVRMATLILENTYVDTEAGFYEYITQQQEEGSSLGEQIGDAFDVDVGIGI